MDLKEKRKYHAKELKVWKKFAKELDKLVQSFAKASQAAKKIKC